MLGAQGSQHWNRGSLIYYEVVKKIQEAKKMSNKMAKTNNRLQVICSKIYCGNMKPQIIPNAIIAIM